MNAFARIPSHIRQTNVEPHVLRLLVKRRSGKKAGVIEIRDDQSVSELDLAVRRILGYSGWDHCSAFFEGVPWESHCIAECYPDNSARGQLKPINTLHLIPSMELGYVYDFGDQRQSSVYVEDILPIDDATDYSLLTKAPSTQRTKKAKKRKSQDNKKC